MLDAKHVFETAKVNDAQADFKVNFMLRAFLQFPRVCLEETPLKVAGLNCVVFSLQQICLS